MQMNKMNKMNKPRRVKAYYFDLESNLGSRAYWNNPRSLEPIQIALANEEGEILYEKYFLPFGPVDEEAKAIHGLTKQDLARYKPFTNEDYEEIM